MIELLLQAERALEMGRVDVAEALYHQVADNDPRNAIAVVGLARVALERGDEAGALELARRALAIDPENAAAGRMVARLEEVAAFRGEPETPADAPPVPEATPIPVTAPTIPPAPRVVTPPRKRRRSWLDRLLRRNR